jgi:hypothetical protein
MVGACWGLTTPFMRKAAMYVPYSLTDCALCSQALAQIQFRFCPELIRVHQELHSAPAPRPHRSEQFLAQKESPRSTVRSTWRLEQTSVCDTVVIECHWQRVVLHIDRQGGIESHGANHELSGILVHRIGRMVGRKEGYQQRYVFWPLRYKMYGAIADTHPDTWIGMAFVLGGIGLCVQSKS